MLRQIILILAALAISVWNLNAQNAAKNWYFGQGARIDFRPTVPAPSAVTTITTNEGCSAISDSTTGNPLFYTDGMTVWDKNNNPMPNGSGLKGNSSSTHSALIVPCSCDKYFIFTTDSFEQGYKNGLCYSIVNMTLNATNGDVVAASKNTTLLPNASEKLAGTSNGSGGFWLVAHSLDDNKFYSYPIRNDCTVGSPIISAVGATYTGGNCRFGAGQMKISPDGKLLAAAGFNSQGPSFVELFQFNAGVVSNLGGSTAHDSSPDTFYGIEFSPDSQSLYATTIQGTNVLYRYDVAPPLAGKTAIHNYGSGSSYILGALQLAPNGTIYMARNGNTSLEYLPTPNTGGGWTGAQFNLASGSTSRIGLPTVVAGDFSCGATATPTPTPTPTPTSTPSATPISTACAQVVAKEVRCEPNGGYTYTFTATNNTGGDMSQILLTPASGSTFTLSPQLFNLSSPLHNGQSTTQSATIGGVKPGDKVCFFASLMSDKAACCTVQVCPTLPVCGAR